MSSPIMSLVPLRVKLGGYSSNQVSGELKLPEHEYYAAAAVSVLPSSAQVTHFVTHLKHNDYQAVSRAPVPLGTIAFANRRASDTARQQSFQGFAPFPGELNDLDAIFGGLAVRGRDADLTARLRLAAYLPRARYPLTLWPLVGGKSLELVAQRVAGADAITELIVWAVRLPRAAFEDACDLTGLPHWVGHEFVAELAAGEIVEEDVFMSAGDGWAIRLRQILAGTYTASGTGGGIGSLTAHNEDFLDAVRDRIRMDDRELYPNQGQAQLRLGQLYAECLQDFDGARDPRLLIGERRHLRHVLAADVLADPPGEKQVYLTHYGTLERSRTLDSVRAV
jgi:hypothetical protein